VSPERAPLRRIWALALLAVWVAWQPAAAQEGTLLDQVRKRGMLRVALYNEFAPFSDQGRGVDVDIAAALAARLGVKVQALWFDADENMEDDLRNMVWKGHYLGYGPADVMMHVPVDRDYMARNDKVMFFAPYHRERYGIAFDTARIPKLESMSALEDQPIGVQGDTLADTALLGADAGRYRSGVRHFEDVGEAVAALREGRVAAVLAQFGELEGALKGAKGFEIVPPPIPMLYSRQWAIGLAVKAGQEDLARALQEAMNALAADGELARIFARHGVVLRKP
jgi:ABC-type amino acid transport substrate-binding protein